MVEGNPNILYLNPLTLEAQWFLNTLNAYGTSHQQIDENLCKVLTKVMTAIEKFLDAKPAQIFETDKTKMVDLNELHCIKRSFMCATCNYKNVGVSVSHAALHLAHQHGRNTNKTKKQREEEKGKKKSEVHIKLPKKAAAFITNSKDLGPFFVENLPIGRKLKQLPEYETIEEELLELVKPVVGDKVVRLFKFGSRFTGIGTRNSDLDIFVDIGNTFNTFENRASANTRANLKLVLNAIRKSNKWKLIAAIENARVPIIKVGNVSTGIECDLGFSNSLGHCNTQLIDYLFELQPAARYMAIYLKKWLERAKLCEHISTYSMTLMIIYFWQLKKLLPSIEKIQIDMEKKIIVGPWIGSFAAKSSTELQITTMEASFKLVKQYLKEFFEYYGNFKYDANVICPYFGLSKVEIKTIEKAMPKHYTEYVNANKEYGLQIKKPMVVQDPIQLNHNVTKAITPFLLQQFIEYCRQSAALFANI